MGKKGEGGGADGGEAPGAGRRGRLSTSQKRAEKGPRRSPRKDRVLDERHIYGSRGGKKLCNNI